jgi:hypothetical protein
MKTQAAPAQLILRLRCCTQGGGDRGGDSFAFNLESQPHSAARDVRLGDPNLLETPATAFVLSCEELFRENCTMNSRIPSGESVGLRWKS